MTFAHAARPAPDAAFHSPTLPVLHSRHRRSLLLAAIAVAATTHSVAAQDDHDDDHHGIHFSHPLVNESPSPDTKLRLDHLWSRAGDAPARTTEQATRVEGEYAFTPALSLAVTVPYVWRDASGADAVRGVGNTELSLKGASARWGERGILVGGGLSVALPTGSDARGIGSSRAVGLEPFADLGVRRGGMQLIAFGHYGTTVRNAPGIEGERELSFAGSASYPVAPMIEALLEGEVVRPMSGQDRAAATSIAPGVKIFPFANRNVMAGVSAPIGLTGGERSARQLLVSLFYHF